MRFREIWGGHLRPIVLVIMLNGLLVLLNMLKNGFYLLERLNYKDMLGM